MPSYSHNVVTQEPESTLSPEERELARKRIVIEKRWHNPNGNGFAYQFKDGTILPLSIYMIKEWARAWVCLHYLLYPS
jgi:hypothetical protein